jgi:hypothetical protein
VLIAPAFIALFMVRFVVGLFLAPPLPVDDAGPTPEPKRHRGTRKPTTEPIAVEVAEALSEVEPVGVPSCAPRAAFPVDCGVPYGGFIGAAPYRFRGG